MGTGFVAHALTECVGIWRHPGVRGAVLKIAYEDVRPQPSSSLLQQLDALELEIPQVNSALMNLILSLFSRQTSCSPNI
jgi:hypothetical protein